ncbi:MAG: family 2 glycosyl transferase [Comamonadaceae bacterium PBBC1]|nr:MAG: family 2 glycosyl transferase [Comamonadaceae bacterium PBBC1]
MFLSICIPQYNRTSFLIESLCSFSMQSFKDFEVCISDGGSTDGGLLEIESFLIHSGMRYKIKRSEKNIQYDENLRTSISLSEGKYILLMGNDDALVDVSTLAYLKDLLDKNCPVGVAITNYHELSTGKDYRRMVRTGILGAGPEMAASTFRHYAFVSGIVMDGESARAATSDKCDGSEMYQMYLGSRLISAGGQFLSIDKICVLKDIQIPGQSVDSYKAKPKIAPCPIIERPLPMGQILQTVAIGIDSVISGQARNRSVSLVAKQLYKFTYPFWIFEYRRVQSFNYALGVYLALRPSKTMNRVKMPFLSRTSSWLIYILAGTLGFFTPLSLFDSARPFLYALAKRGQKLIPNA